MRQRTLLKICTAAIVILHVTVWGTVLSARTGRNQAKADRGEYSYATAYESDGGRGYRDIMPENGTKSGNSYEEDGSRAASVSGGSLEVKYPEGDQYRKKCSTTTYIVRKGDTIYGISRKTGADVNSIMTLNSASGSRIKPGMKLRIETCGRSGSGDSVKKNKSAAAYERGSSAKLPHRAISFSWPLKKINNYKRDGSEDIKSIGIFITGAPGSDVVASLDGVVKKIGFMRGYGRYVAISHEGRYVTVYSNLSNIHVKEGDSVVKGGVIGTLSSDRTLHFQIGHAGKPENPLKHLPGRG